MATASVPKKAVGYVRVSTEGQADNGVSLDAQRARIGAWCEANGYEPPEVHTDAGVSGKRSDNRPGLQAALKAVCKAKGVLVVYSLSRLARSTRDTLELADSLDRAGADLVSLSEQLDTTSAAGKMVFRLLAVLAEFERDLASERTRAALAHKRARGERTGGTVPDGWSLQADGVRLVADPDEQAVVTLILDRRRDGWTYQRIADELHRRGIRPKCGATWHPKVVRGICRRVAEPHAAA